MVKKLTSAQAEVLRLVAAGKVHRSESIHNLYKSFHSDTFKNLSRQIDVLAEAAPQLIEIGERVGVRRPWHITEAGTELLAALDKEA